MIIAFDGGMLSRQATGIGDITISIINSFIRNFKDDDFYILINEPVNPEVLIKLELRDNVKIIQKQLPFLKSVNLLWSVFQLNDLIKKIKPDVFIESNFLLSPIGFPSKTKLIVYIHDVVFKEHPKTMQLVTRLYMGLFFRSSLKRADLVWTNSNYTNQSLLRYYGKILQNKSLFTGSGVNPYFLNRCKQVAKRPLPFIINNSSIDFKYLLFVGTTEPRKNLPFLLKLLAELKEKDYHLLIAGNKGWGAADKSIAHIIDAPGFPKEKLKILGYVTNDELIVLYKGAFAFISTSFNEGLGLPQLEAMACGCPVISPHNSAMKEVVYNAGITVDGWLIDDWKAAIGQIAANRQEYIDKGFLKIKDYNWDNVVKNIYNQYLSK